METEVEMTVELRIAPGDYRQVSDALYAAARFLRRSGMQAVNDAIQGKPPAVASLETEQFRITLTRG